MGLRNVRLDDETLKVLKQVMRETGWSISAALKYGVLVLRDAVGRTSQRSKFTVASTLGLAATGSHLRLSHDWACSASCNRNIDHDPPTSNTCTNCSRKFQGEEYLSGYY